MGQGFWTPHPLENHKAIDFLSNNGPDALENHKNTKAEFTLGPSLNGVSLASRGLVVFISSLNSSTKKKTPPPPHPKKKKKKKKLCQEFSGSAHAFICFAPLRKSTLRCLSLL